MEIEYVYGLREYLKSLYMFKYLHDIGIDITPFHDICELGPYDAYYNISQSSSYINFLTISQKLFEIVETYDTYDDEVIDDKKYWLHKADIELETNNLESSTVIVLLDPSLKNPVMTGSIGEDDFSGGSGELAVVDGGLVLHYDMDYGELNWTEVLIALLETQAANKREEELNYAMAI